ncbi:hypothetical protein TMatcc_010243 [Talaromyces marneffei ATCC 18224]|uniref:uncharacterized protein n=1 Tax=Talaromyces marneffei TaxID=37727 RepID=UPI0012A78328|nr:uncharacterized protein EYB26_009954 [Talaromyces marneffei]KAE8548896.1 hypothetical protein EYB25_009279 [Talaromyces marneffei]QGA22238.1 hypothetical protein EYB26_009954 [Talaromyces marneffei]
MLIDGEKWACEACVRGHRVSSCRHNDRPLIRINKKGRPFSVCIICRGPCNSREEHSKLNRDKKSDGESDSKSSGKKPSARRRIQPSSFARIAPHPAPLPSTSEPFTTSQSRSRSRRSPSNPRRSLQPSPPTSSSSMIATTVTTTASTFTSNGYIPPFDPALVHSTGTYMPGFTTTAPLAGTTSPMGYPYVSLPMMEEPFLPTSSAYPFTDDMMFAADNGFVSDSMYTGFEDMDALPEDWSTFFWNDS